MGRCIINYKQFQKILGNTEVIRPPRYRLATFGSSEIQYHLVTAISSKPPLSHLRLGHVTTKKPQILTPETIATRFEGFGVDEKEFEEWLNEYSKDKFRSLEYNFQNKLKETSLRRQNAQELAGNIKKDLDSREAFRSTVILGPEIGWQFSLMKFIIEETMKSFPRNVQELHERGLFDPEQTAINQRKHEIRTLFNAAQTDPTQINKLGKLLKEYNMFETYQDSFFELVKK